MIKTRVIWFLKSIFSFSILCTLAQFSGVAFGKDLSQARNAKLFDFPIGFSIQLGENQIRKDAPIILTATIFNGTNRPIIVSICNGLYLSLYLTQEGEPLSCTKPVPKKAFPSPGSVEVLPGSSFSSDLNLREWEVEGGWKRGSFRISALLKNVWGELPQRKNFSLQLKSNVLEFSINE